MFSDSSSNPSQNIHICTGIRIRVGKRNGGGESAERKYIEGGKSVNRKDEFNAYNVYSLGLKSNVYHYLLSSAWLNNMFLHDRFGVVNIKCWQLCHL